MMTELCKGPHDGGDGLGQWVRTEEAESEIRDPDSSPSCRQWCVALGKSFSLLSFSSLIWEITGIPLVEAPFCSILMLWMSQQRDGLGDQGHLREIEEPFGIHKASAF